MKLSIALLALAVLPTVVPAQGSAIGAVPPTAPAKIDEPKTQPVKARTISKDLSSVLSAGINFQSPSPLKPVAKPIDLSEVDNPQDDIIRLPKHVVREMRPPDFSDRELYSKEMLRNLAYLRYTSAFSRNVLNRYHIFGQADVEYAMMQYEAEERMRNIAEMKDKIAMYRVAGDTASADELTDDIQRTFMRRTNFSRRK